MNEGIESMSLNPDTVLATWKHLAKVKPRDMGACGKKRRRSSAEWPFGARNAWPMEIGDE